MGGKVSIKNDSEVPIEVWFELRGGFRPKDGYGYTTLAPTELETRKFAGSLPLTVCAAYKRPEWDVPKNYYKHVFAPARRRGHNVYYVSEILGFTPKKRVRDPNDVTIRGYWVKIAHIGNLIGGREYNVTWTEGITETESRKTINSNEVKTNTNLSLMWKKFDISHTFKHVKEDLRMIARSGTKQEHIKVTLPSHGGGFWAYQYHFEAEYPGEFGFDIGSKIIQYTYDGKPPMDYFEQERLGFPAQIGPMAKFCRGLPLQNSSKM